MAMVARRLGSVQNVVVRRTGLGDGALLLPASRTIASISSPISKASPNQSRRSPSCRNTYSTSAARETAPVTMMQPLIGPPCVLRAGGSVGGNSITCIRRNLHWNSGDRAVATAADWRRPPLCAVLCQGHASRAGGMPSSGAVEQLPSGGLGVVFPQSAGLRTMSRVFAPADDGAAGKKPGGAAASLPQPGSRSGHGSKTPSPCPTEIRPPASSGERSSSNMGPPSAKLDNPQAAEKLMDDERTVKGGNPDLRREREGRLVEMRDRIRHARADASEDAKDWMRDKRDDMNTMKEVHVKTHPGGALPITGTILL